MADAAKAMGKAGDRNELIILIMFQCALRVSEELNLRVKDRIRYQNGYILAVLVKAIRNTQTVSRGLSASLKSWHCASATMPVNTD